MLDLHPFRMPYRAGPPPGTILPYRSTAVSDGTAVPPVRVTIFSSNWSSQMSLPSYPKTGKLEGTMSAFLEYHET